MLEQARCLLIILGRIVVIRPKRAKCLKEQEDCCDLGERLRTIVVRLVDTGTVSHHFGAHRVVAKLSQNERLEAQDWLQVYPTGHDACRTTRPEPDH